MLPPATAPGALKPRLGAEIEQGSQQNPGLFWIFKMHDSHKGEEEGFGGLADASKVPQHPLANYTVLTHLLNKSL